MMALIAREDWRLKRILDEYVWGLLIARIVSVWIIPEISLIQRATGIIAVSVPLFVLACIVPGSIGGGDIKLMAAGGFLIGKAGIWNAFTVGIMGAGIYSLMMLLMKKAEWKSEIAMGPFLCIGIVFEILKM